MTHDYAALKAQLERLGASSQMRLIATVLKNYPVILDALEAAGQVRKLSNFCDAHSIEDLQKECHLRNCKPGFVILRMGVLCE